MTNSRLYSSVLNLALITWSLFVNPDSLSAQPSPQVTELPPFARTTNYRDSNRTWNALRISNLQRERDDFDEASDLPFTRYESIPTTSDQIKALIKNHSATLKDVEHLQLGGLTVSPKQLSPLAQLTSVRRLTLNGRTTAQRLAKLIEIFPSLQWLRIDDYVSMEHARALLKARMLETLDISTRKPLQVDAFTALGKMKTLRTLRLPPTPISKQGLLQVCQNRNLEGIGLSGVRLTDEHLAILTKLTKLKRLNIGSNPDLTDQGMLHLRQLTALRSIDLSYDYQITGAGLAVFSSLPKLKQLYICKAEISDSDLEKLQTIPSLESISVYCHDFSPQTAAVLSKLKRLKLVFVPGLPSIIRAISQNGGDNDLRVIEAGVRRLQKTRPDLSIVGKSPPQLILRR